MLDWFIVVVTSLTAIAGGAGSAHSGDLVRDIPNAFMHTGQPHRGRSGRKPQLCRRPSNTKLNE